MRMYIHSECVGQASVLHNRCTTGVLESPPFFFFFSFFFHFLVSLLFYMFSFTPVEVSLSSGKGTLKFMFTVFVSLSEFLSHTRTLIYRQQCTILSQEV